MATKKSKTKKSKAKKSKAKKSKAKKSGTKKAGASSKGKKPWTFPQHTLEEAIRVARSIEDKNAGRPMRSEDLVKAVGFNKSKDWRYQILVKSSELYGLTAGTGERATVSLQQTGADIVAPSSPPQRQSALLQALRNVDKFREVEEHYSGKRIPEDEYFENTLVRDFGIDRERVAKFIEVFRANAGYLNLFAAHQGTPEEDDGSVSLASSAREAEDPVRIREFLDTCFVMMPFGKWFDRYYKEIYTGAIKEAGLEPVRADELFATGTVVEQIWEEIRKAPVLLADLSNKNANVFYELGLAHAKTKPVVFTASSLDDVPFDLRHLRVIIYDCREPGWDLKLAKQITEHLKASRRDPEKSIPQPFRDSYRSDDEAV